MRTDLEQLNAEIESLALLMGDLFDSRVEDTRTLTLDRRALSEYKAIQKRLNVLGTDMLEDVIRANTLLASEYPNTLQEYSNDFQELRVQVRRLIRLQTYREIFNGAQELSMHTRRLTDKVLERLS